MNKLAVFPLAASVSAGLLMLSCQQAADASAQSKWLAPKGNKGLISGAPVGSITVLSFPTAQDVYIVPKGHVNPGDATRFTNEKYFAGKTPLQVARPAVNYYVVVKQCPPDSYRADGERNHLYAFSNEKRTFTDAKIYSIIHEDDKRSFVSSLIWPDAMAPTDFMRKLSKEMPFTVSDADLAQIKAFFQKKGAPDAEWESLVTLLRTTGKAVWHGKNNNNVCAYFSAIDARGELQELTLLPLQ